MAIISMSKLIFVFPVPVTPFNQMLAILININPSETILMTGIPSVKKSSFCPNK
jgi:hypothetical protein